MYTIWEFNSLPLCITNKAENGTNVYDRAEKKMSYFLNYIHTNFSLVFANIFTIFVLDIVYVIKLANIDI